MVARQSLQERSLQTRDCWPKKRLGELIHIKHGYAFKGEYFSDSGPFVVLTPGNFHDQGGFKDKGEKEKHYIGEVPKDFILKKGDLLVAMTEQAEGLLGSSAIVPSSDSYLHNQRLGLVTEVDKAEIDRTFLYYLFNTTPVRQQIRASASGTKVRHTSPARIYQVVVAVPSLPIQRKVAEVLSAYDRVIENNLRRIKILEEMAQALYREWFVNLRFPGHENTKVVDSAAGKIPKDWKRENLFEVAEVTYGFPFKSKLFSETPKGRKVIRIRDIQNSVTKTFTTERVADRYVVQNGDLVVGMDGDFHIGKWTGGEAYLNQRVVRFRPKHQLPVYYLLLALKRPIEHFGSTIVGTTVAHLGDQHLRTINLLIPGDEIVKRLHKILNPIFQMEVDLRLVNTNLRLSRDLLLPKLISGEIEV